MRRSTISIWTRPATLAVVLVLAGCAGPIQVKDVVSSPEGYSALNLSQEQLSPTVRQHLPAFESEPLPFKRLKVRGTQEYTVAGQQPVKSSIEETFINDSNNGVLRQIDKFDQNGVPAAFLIMLNYHGIWPLMSQRGAYANRYMLPIMEIKEITTWPAGMRDVQENQTYSYVSDAGYRGALTTVGKETITCRSGVAYEASKVSPGIPGKALDLECSRTNTNGAQASKFTYAWLMQYRVALLMGSNTARLTSTYHYDDIVAN